MIASYDRRRRSTPGTLTRLINASSARIYGLRFESHAPWLVALDGHAVAPRRAERVVLGPAMRADLVLDCNGAPGSRHRVIDDFYRRRAYRLLDLQYTDEDAVRSSFAPVPRLAANPVAAPISRAPSAIASSSPAA